jgi:ankyrin repeat protein
MAMARLLSLAGDRIDVNLADNEGCSPLSIAAYFGRADVLKCMLSWQHVDRIDVNKADSEGRSPLAITCWFGHAAL